MQTVYHARDIPAVLSVEPASVAKVRLKCVVLSRNKQKRSVFLNLQDESGAVQAVVEKEKVHDSVWTAAINLRAGEAATIHGELTTAFRGAQVRATAISPVLPEQPRVDRGGRVGTGSPVSQVYAARLKRIVREYYQHADYAEIATRLISSIPPPSPGVYPLRVLYPGYGAPFYITPSPAPQLIDALTSTAYDQLFTVARCFTQVYRDPQVSVESVIVTSIKRKEGIQPLLVFADQMVRELLLRPETRTAHKSDWPNTQIVRLSRLGANTSAAVTCPEIQIFTESHSDVNASEVGRLCWPLEAAGTAEFREYVLAEGYTAGLPDDPAFSIMSINVDRLLTLILEQADLRRIPALGAAV